MSDPNHYAKRAFLENMKLSKHFTLDELTATSVARFQSENKMLSDHNIDALKHLCSKILDPIRDHFGLPVCINSGYRCSKLNAYLNGSMGSQHLFGEAADFFVDGLDDLVGSLHVFDWIYKESDIPFGQVIHEYKRKGDQEKIWIHISCGEPYRPECRSRQVLRFQNGSYTRLLNPRFPKA